MRRSPRALWAIAAVLVLAPCPALGQLVRGRVIEAGTSAPLPGALVSLIADDDARVAAALSDARGVFTLRAPAHGTYRVRAERIGMRTEVSDPLRVGSTQTEALVIELRETAVPVAGVSVETQAGPCRADPLEAPRLQRWWDEARKALEVSALVQAERLVQLQIVEFEREWSPDLRARLKERSTSQVVHAYQPFESLPPTELAEGGFMRGTPGSRELFAPDARVLLSREFLAGHCFALTGAEDQSSLIGIAFEPTRSSRVPDIRGAFWVDTTTAELRFLDYRYTGLPEDMPEGEAGGRVEFEYLPSGAWIVGFWWIRIPRLGVRREMRTAGRTENSYQVVGYRDVGGRVEGRALAESRRDAPAGTGVLRGQVFDSIGDRPLPGARVVISGTRFATTSDENGRYTLSGVPPGSWSVTFFHESLAPFDLAGQTVEVAIGDGENVEVNLDGPGFGTVVSQLCWKQPSSTTILAGKVSSTGGVALSDARVQARWTRPDQPTGARREERLEALGGSDGRYVLCGVPPGIPVEVRVMHAERWIPVLELVLSSRRLEHRDLIIQAGS